MASRSWRAKTHLSCMQDKYPLPELSVKNGGFWHAPRGDQTSEIILCHKPVAKLI